MWGRQWMWIFLDFSKDFATVFHSTLLDKMCSLHLDMYMIQWVNNWQKDQAQRVVVNGVISEWQPVVDL